MKYAKYATLVRILIIYGNVRPSKRVMADVLIDIISPHYTIYYNILSRLSNTIYIESLCYTVLP